jgi:transmembrane sensor
MALDPRHTQEFQALEKVWQDFAVLPRPALLPPALLEKDEYDSSLAVSEWNARRNRARVRRRSMAFALAASLILAGIALGTFIAVRAGTVEVLETRVGENRAVRLADGSRISMGGASRIEVRMESRRRELTLVRGEALFAVAKDAARPFSVHAGAATVTAVGTQFDVRRNVDRVVISVLEGRVRVQPLRAVVPVAWLAPVVPSIARGNPAELDAKHRATVDEHGMGAAVALPEVSVATAWESGRLSFDDEPLRYVVEVVNRYSGKRIVIADSEIADLRVSGTVLGEHIDGWVASLNTAFGIRATEDDGTITLAR